jgi:hypothetical protein
MGDKKGQPDPWKRPVKKRNATSGRYVAKDGPEVEKNTDEHTHDPRNTPKERSTGAKNNEDRYVVKHADGWAVKKENAERASGVFHTQKEAIDRAREIVEKTGGGRGDIRIQGKDGRFRDSDSGSRNETDAKDKK